MARHGPSPERPSEAAQWTLRKIMLGTLNALDNSQTPTRAGPTKRPPHFLSCTCVAQERLRRQNHYASGYSCPAHTETKSRSSYNVAEYDHRAQRTWSRRCSYTQHLSASATQPPGPNSGTSSSQTTCARSNSETSSHAYTPTTSHPKCSQPSPRSNKYGP